MSRIFISFLVEKSSFLRLFLRIQHNKLRAVVILCFIVLGTFLHFNLNLAQAQVNPPVEEWIGEDTGSPLAGSSVYDAASDRFLIQGAGADIWGTSDSFRYTFREATGDSTMVVRVDSLQNTHSWAKAGVMFRESSAPGSRHVMIVVTPSSGISFQRRVVTGGNSSDSTQTGLGVPRWLKLEKRGQRVWGYSSADGQNWVLVGSDDFPAVTYRAGMAVTSHNASSTSAAVFSQVSLQTAMQHVLPASWEKGDIGTTGATGVAEVKDGVFNIHGAGTDIWGSADSFFMARTELVGDGSITARVLDMDNTHPWAKAGVMIRDNLSPGSPHAMLAMTPGYGLSFATRNGANNSSSQVNQAGLTGPRWVRLVRTGTTITAFQSPNGLQWNSVGSMTMASTLRVYVGLAVSSHNNGKLCIARFDQVVVNPTPSTPLPAPWVQTSVGLVGLQGATRYEAGVFDVHGSGSDIWGGADAFHYVYQPLAANGILVARITSQVNTDQWAKAGIMIRETLAPNSRHAMIVQTPSNGVSFQRRISTAGISTDNTFNVAPVAARWLKVERWGRRIDAYFSSDATIWNYAGSQELAFDAGYIGLAVTSHNNSLASKAVFDSVSLSTEIGVPSSEFGFKGDYYQGTNFNNHVLTRRDERIAFNWSGSPPASGVTANDFSVRWTGRIVPIYSETYNFHTFTDDGVRLWVNGQLLINDWTSHPEREATGSITLQAGVLADIKMEYYQAAGSASARLLWSSASTPKQLISPRSLIYPTAANVDSDYDGLSDQWEMTNFGNLNQTATANPDGDQWNNLQEYQQGLNPNVSNGNPKYIVIQEAGQFQVFSEDLRRLGNFPSPDDSSQLCSDPRGGFWMSFVTAGKLSLRYYGNWNNFTNVASTINADYAKAISWSEQELLIVYQVNGENYLTSYDLRTNSWKNAYKLLDANGQVTGITTTGWIFGIQRLKATGKVWIKQAEYTSSFDLNALQPGREINRLHWNQTGYGNAIGTIGFSDTQLASIDKNWDTNGGLIRVWNPEELNNSQQTYTYIPELSSTYGYYTSLTLLKDGRFLAGSSIANTIITEISPNRSVRHVNTGVPLFGSVAVGTNDTGGVVEVTDQFGDIDNDGLLDIWEMTNFGNLNQNAGADLDGDGLTNLQEYQQGSNPNDFYNGSTPRLEIVSGNNQSGEPNSFVPEALKVRVKDSFGISPLVNAPVAFAVVNPALSHALSFASSGAPVTFKSVTLRTDSQGIATLENAFPLDLYYRLPTALGNSKVRATAGEQVLPLEFNFTVLEDSDSGEIPNPVNTGGVPSTDADPPYFTINPPPPSQSLTFITETLSADDGATVRWQFGSLVTDSNKYHYIDYFLPTGGGTWGYSIGLGSTRYSPDSQSTVTRHHSLYPTHGLNIGADTKTMMDGSSATVVVSIAGPTTITWDKDSDDFEVYRDGALLSTGVLQIQNEYGEIHLEVVPGKYATGGEKIKFSASGHVQGEHENIPLPNVSITLTNLYSGGRSETKIPLDEASGAKYRKIALSGRPLPDEKPQASKESDQQEEETFIDAMTLGLRHSTTDVYVPVAGSELALSVRRNAAPELWTLKSGLRPHERLDRPFGSAWGSNLCASIQFENKIGDLFSIGFMDPNYATVTDENGSSYRFAIVYGNSAHSPSLGFTGIRKFIPMPTGKHEQSTYLTTLTETTSGNLVFERKYGTRIQFEGVTGLTQTISMDRAAGSKVALYLTYARAKKVTDRQGNSLIYSYTGMALVPNTIAVEGRPDQVISIEQSKQSDVSASPSAAPVVTAIWDPRGNKTQFIYEYVAETKTMRLREVIDANLARTRYDYNYAFQEDPTDQRPISPVKKRYHHIDLSKIQDPLNHTYTFDYEMDSSRKFLWNGRQTPQAGTPRIVKTVTLPNLQKTHFTNLSSFWIEARQITGTRKTQVIDAQENTRSYEFVDPVIFTAQNLKSLYGWGRDFNEPRVVAYRRMIITHENVEQPDGTSQNLTEEFEFNPDAGLSLSKAKDIHGNTTQFIQGDIWNAPPVYREAFPRLFQPNSQSPAFNGYYDEPTSQINALNREKSFRYDALTRIMNRVLDEEGRVTVYEVDTLGRRKSEKIYSNTSSEASDAWSQKTSFVYDTPFPGFLSRRTVSKKDSDPAWAKDLVTQYIPDANGRIAEEITDPAGLRLVTKYAYDKNGNKRSATDPRNKTTNFTYDRRNRLTTVTNADGSQKQMVYNTRGNKIKESDENGNVTLFAYDTLNRLTDQARDMNGNGVIDSRTVDLVTSFTYNDVNSKLSQTDPNGNTSNFVYDKLQRVTSARTPAVLGAAQGYTTTFEYGVNSGASVFDSSTFKPTKTTDPRGYVTEVTYDKLYRSMQTKAQINLSPATYAISSTEYDAVGNAKASIDPLGKRSETDYDAINRPTVVRFAVATAGQVNPAYGFAQTFYTATGLKYKTQDELSRVSEMEYDAAGRPTKTIAPGVFDQTTQTLSRPTTQSFYDAASNLTATINPLIKRWDFIYDDRNRKVTELQPAVFDQVSGLVKRPTLTTVYDNTSKVTQTIDARGNTAYTLYDKADRPTHSVAPLSTVILANNSTAILSTVMRMDYDANGNVLKTYRGGISSPSILLSSTSPYSVPLTELATTADNTYDALNRLTATKDALNITVNNEYDAAGNRLAVVDGKNQRTEFTYDGLNRNLSIKDPANKSVTFLFNALNKTKRTDSLGQVTDYGYDDRHRLLNVDYNSNNTAINSDRNYSYDLVGNLQTVTEPGKGTSADAAYTYDALNRQSTETSGGLQHQYKYDLAGNRQLTIYGGTNRSISSTYDALNRLQTMTEGSNVTSYAYDLNGGVAKLTQPNQDTIEKTFDALNRMGDIVTKTAGITQLSKYTQNYDLAGNVRKVDETYSSGALSNRVILNTYDAINRLTTEAISTGASIVSTTYAYDNAHNRTGKIVAGGTAPGTTNYISNNLNQLTATTGALVSSYTYDFNGNRQTYTKNAQTDTYGYDFENRLVQLQKNVTGTGIQTGTFTYNYDYRMRRVLRNETAAGGIATKLVFSGGTSVQEYNVNFPATPVVEYIRGSDYGGGIGGILYTLRSGTASFNHYNSRGDVVAKTAANGALTYQAAYEAYGKRTQEQGSTQDRQKANTKDEDPTGLLNEGFRYRDLETGTFITRDPLMFVDGPNMYAYVVQNPWTKFDPLGLAAVDGKKRKDLAKEHKENSAEFQKAHEKHSKLAEKGRPETRKDARELRMARQDLERLVKDSQDLYQAIGTIDKMVGTFNATSGVTAGGFKITESARDNIEYGGEQFQALSNYSIAFNAGTAAIFSAAGPVISQSAGGVLRKFGQSFAAKTELTVIGHLKPPTGPGYVEVAESMGANYLKPSASWNWQKQGDFIKSVIQRGDDVLIGTPIRPGDSVLRHEIKQLIKAGYVPAEQGSKLLIKTAP